MRKTNKPTSKKKKRKRRNREINILVTKKEEKQISNKDSAIDHERGNGETEEVNCIVTVFLFCNTLLFGERSSHHERRTARFEAVRSS
jgi:hypothetical protein